MRIAPMQAGKILGLLYACFGLLLLPFIAFGGLMGVFASHAGQLQNASAPPPAVIGAVMFGMAIGAPILYGLMGFLGGVIMAALYNLFARWVGGLEVEVE